MIDEKLNVKKALTSILTKNHQPRIWLWHVKCRRAAINFQVACSQSCEFHLTSWGTVLHVSCNAHRLSEVYRRTVSRLCSAFANDAAFIFWGSMPTDILAYPTLVEEKRNLEETLGQTSVFPSIPTDASKYQRQSSTFITSAIISERFYYGCIVCIIIARTMIKGKSENNDGGRFSRKCHWFICMNSPAFFLLDSQRNEFGFLTEIKV